MITKNLASIKTRILIIVFILVFSQISCGNFFCPHSIDTRSIVVVPEKNYCCGPLHLPLNEEDEHKLEAFLKRGGINFHENTTTNLEDYEYYASLIEILSEPEDDDNAFLRDYDLFHEFKNNKRTNKASAFLRQWFRDPIVEDFVDAKEKDKKFPIPISLMGIGEKYWWIFYKFEREEISENESTEEINFKKITKLTVILSVKRQLKHY